MKKLLAMMTILFTFNATAYTDAQVLSFLLIHPEVEVLIEKGNIEEIEMTKENSGTSWIYNLIFKIKSEESKGILNCTHKVTITELGGIVGSYMSEPKVLDSHCRLSPKSLNPDDFISNPGFCGYGGPLMINEETGVCIQSLDTCLTAQLRKDGYRPVREEERESCNKSKLF